MVKLLEYVSRKFVLALAGLGTGFYLAISEHGGNLGAYTGLVATVLGFYNGANVAQDWMNSRKADKKDT